MPKFQARVKQAHTICAGGGNPHPSHAGGARLRDTPTPRRFNDPSRTSEALMEQTLSVGATAGVMRGMRGVVLGVANNRSIAWGIAKAAQAAGAELAFTFQGEALEKRVRPLAQELGAHVLGHCDVTEGGTIDSVFAEAGKLWEAVDFVVHCIAFSDKDQLTGRYINTTEDNFTKSLAISCYSFTAVAQRAEKLMPSGGSMLTLTYYGAEKWMPHYNVMGVAKAALEASVWYLAADLGVKNIRVNASLPARSKRSPLPALPIFVIFSGGTNTTRRYAATSRS